jgi:dTDP-4-dehydrorhamnose 3,5-epimerase
VQIDGARFPEVLVMTPDVFSDERGSFFESWNESRFGEYVGFDVRFVQDNHSSSKSGVLRGLHYQLEPKPQGKLVRVIAGEIFDVVVDLRRSSGTFGRWAAFRLSAKNKSQLWVPPGFAHGLLALLDGTEVLYKVTEYYSAEHDRSIRWDDPDLRIEWPLRRNPILSDKDANAPYLNRAELFE